MEATTLFWIHQHIPNSPFFISFFKFWSFFGESKTLLFLILFLTIFFIFNGSFKKAHIIILTGVISLLTSTILKKIIARPRPDIFPPLEHVTSYSFPSGHALATIAVYGTIALFLAERYPSKKRIIYTAVSVFIFLIGLSRLYLGVHWPIDVAGGWLIGGAILAVMIWWYHKGGIVKMLRIALGGLLLLFGIVGIIIPIVPGIFLIVAAFLLIFSDKSVTDLLKKKDLKRSPATGLNPEDR